MATGGTNTEELSDETFDFCCNVCKRKGKTTEAKKYCTDCYDYYCLTCVKVHDDIPSLTGHKIIDREMFRKGSAEKLPVVPTERCAKHSLKPVDMYCQNHDHVGCSTCIAVEHRLCKDIFHIPDHIQNMASTCNPKKIQEKLASTWEILKVTVQNCEQEKQHLLERKAESIQNVRHIRKEFDQRFDELEQASVAEIENKYEEMLNKIEKDIITFRDAKRNVVSAQDKLADAGNNTYQIFVSTKMGESYAMEAEEILKKTNITCYYEDISLSADKNIKEMLEKLKSLGEVTSKALLRGLKNISIKDESDLADYGIISSCILEDGTIMLADQENKKLKRLDSSTYCVRDHYNLPGCPWQVCSINNQEIAVSYKMNEIMFISVGNQLKQKSITKTDFDCHALAYGNDNLYISDQYKSVYIYSVSGQKLKQLRMTGQIQSWINDNLSGSKEFNIRGLAVNEDGSKIYVASSEKGLIILDNNGKVVQKFNTYASCVHLTSAGTVLVCGFTNILQLRPDGELIGEALKCRGEHITVSCNRQMSKMIVRAKRKHDLIYVYDLV